MQAAIVRQLARLEAHLHVRERAADGALKAAVARGLLLRSGLRALLDIACMQSTATVTWMTQSLTSRG